ncbi:MAG: type IV pilus assembly protein PilM, partial [Phycisphaeraceae bacterium]
MSNKKEAWGVEVGAQAIKAMKLGRSGDGVSLLDFDVMPFKQVLTTPDLNVEEAIRVNLDALATKHEFDKSTVVVSVPGHMAFARFAKLPPIEASKVKSIVAYEAQQQIPFPIEEVEWDYQVFAQEDAPDIEVGIFAITKERVAHFLSNYRSVGMRVDMLTLSPVAVYNAFAFENEGGDGHGEGTVYLDIGTTSTDIIVVEDEAIWLRTLPLGGNHFTQALMKQFKISFAKAEKLKLEAGTSKYAKQIFQAMRGVFSDLVTEIQRSLGFYTSLNRDSELNRIVGVGSTWKLPGLQKYLKQNLQMVVTRPDGFAQLEVEDRRAAEFSSVAVNMATSYGLALQGLGLSAVDANILPQTILRQRMWKAKQPWIVAAAGCVVGAAALGPVMQFLEGQRFSNAWTPVESEIDATIATAQDLKNTYETVQTNDPRPGIRNYRRGFDYADLYPSLYADVALAMVRKVQAELRDDLRILVMSATLQT